MLSALAAALAPHGFNLVGTTPVEAYDAAVPPAGALRCLMPEVRTAIVVGNGGGDLWTAFRDHCRRHPGHDETDDPLDAYTRMVVEDAVARVCGTMPVRVVYPFRFPAEPVSFMRLAACAGLGRPGLVGVLLHPVYGPWIAMRAAVLVPIVLAAERPAEAFDPCPGCVERACIPACPAGAVGTDGWDIPRCAGQRAAADPCAARCAARFECVLGRAHRYPPAALAYHQARARAALLAWRPPA